MKHIEKIVLLLRRRHDHILVFFNKCFLRLESLVTLNGKATFFFSPHGCILGALDQLQRSDCGTGILVQLLVFTFFIKMKVHYFAFQRFQVCNQLIGISPCNHIGPFTRIVQLKKKSRAFFFGREERNIFL